jgi:DEAD/DEAH box helicase domain-containing protein
MGITKFYSHQSEAIKYIGQGYNVVIATPTASGKSMIYNLTVLDSILKNRDRKALYVFPLKALEQDQLKNLSELTKRINSDKISASVYDGDTSPYMRKKIKADIPEILFTNPDMLHRGIMAYHESWKDLFENLSFMQFIRLKSSVYPFIRNNQ